MQNKTQQSQKTCPTNSQKKQVGYFKTALFEKAINLALEGNEHMLKLLLDRFLPAKPKDDPSSDIGYKSNYIVGWIERKRYPTIFYIYVGYHFARPDLQI